MPTAVFDSLTTVSLNQAITSLVLFHYAQCFLLYSAHVLYTNTLPSLGSLSLCPLLSLTVYPLCVSISHYTAFDSLSLFPVLFSKFCPLCLYITLYRLLVLCHYVHCCLRQSANCVCLYHIIPPLILCHYAQCYLQNSVHCVSTSHCTVSWFSVTMSTALYDSLPTVCIYITLYVLRFSVTMPNVIFNILSTVSLHHTVPSLGSLSQCPLLSTTVCPLCVSTSHCTSFGSLSLCPM